MRWTRCGPTITRAAAAITWRCSRRTTWPTCATHERPSYKALADARGWAVHDVTNRLAATRRDFRAHVLRLLREACASEDEYEREARALFG